MENHKELYRFMSMIKESRVSKEMFIGTIVMMMLNKKIFDKNISLSKFVNEAFNLSLPLYIVRSRTLMVAKICRIIFSCDNDTITIYRNNVFNLLENMIPADNNVGQNKAYRNKMLKNGTSSMDSWVSEILKRNS